jgi:hypothetical protein
MQINPSVLAGVIGLPLLWIMSLPVGWLVRQVRNSIPLPPPTDALTEQWTTLTTDPNNDHSGAIVGILE